jgi:voltage-gated potassium channel
VDDHQGNENSLGIRYELIMIMLALIVMVILLIEYAYPLAPQTELLFMRIDLAILLIFTADYGYRLWHAKQKLRFVRNNLFDLLAIIPFDKAFRLARLARIGRIARLARLSRTSKLARVMNLMGKITGDFQAIMKTNGLQYVILFAGFSVLIGAVAIMALEPRISRMGDAIWWALVTTTTVGYGDLSPETAGGRIVAGILMIVGIGLIGMVTGSVATFFVSRLSKTPDRKSVDVEQIEYFKSNLDILDQLSQDDLESTLTGIRHIWKQKMQKRKAGLDE